MQGQIDVLQPLGARTRAGLFLLSFFLMAYGQSALIWWLGPLAACCGFAMFWRMLLDYPRPLQRFGLGVVWFSMIQLVQFSWALMHPFPSFFGAYVFGSLWYGVQYGVFCLLITRERFAKPFFPFVLAACWTLIEWSRLLILSGSSWNPVGLMLTGNVYSLQMTSLIGIYGLSFFVTAINGLCLAWWIGTAPRFTSTCATAMIAFPFAFGGLHVGYHSYQKSHTNSPSINALLLQTSFPVAEWLAKFTPQEAFRLALQKWVRILELVKPYEGKDVDLILLPENVIPFAAYTPIYSHDNVKKVFAHVLGPDSLSALPDLESGSAMSVDTAQGKAWLVTNAYVAQALSNWMKANVVIGLEDRQDNGDGTSRSYTSAFYFTLSGDSQEKYDKRVLVPMGEYIPFAVIAPYLQDYGVHSSFTPGSAAKVIQCRGIPMGLSICYEETYGHLMRDNRLQGAQVLLNLTNDGWWPNSHLPHQHFEHSRPRAVEMGIPLVRACNTGYTCVVDSLGRSVASIDDTSRSGALLASIPLYHYSTLYAQTGDSIVIGTCVAIGSLFCLRRRRK